MEKTIFKHVFIGRLHELVLVNMFLSIPLTFVCLQQGASDRVIMITLTAGVAVYMLIQMRMLRQCYFDLQILPVFYLANYASWLAFAGLHGGLYYICNTEIYTWLFSITKFAQFSEYNISSLQSVLIFHGCILVLILAAPLGMRKYFASEPDM